LTTQRTGLAVSFLILLQLFSAIFFLWDAASDFINGAATALDGLYLPLEFMASLSLLAAIGFEIHYLNGLHKRQARMRRQLSLAGMAIEDVVETLFGDWNLSAAERDVGGLLVKGLNIAEIAALRGNAEGTIKAHLNAIYRKSGARSRADVLSLVVDAVMGRDAAASSPAVMMPALQAV
jgi:DNA-binding CsgD family transcriptional regulator